MLNIIKTKAQHLPQNLTESFQSNPLRWEILYKKEDGIFESQTNVFKCRDYFNDVVAKYKGFDTNAYGFLTANMKFNVEGIYIHLHSCTSCLAKNIELISQQAQKQDFPPLVVLETSGNELLLFMPVEYLRSTYISSLVTYFIRVGNIEESYTTFKEFLKNNPNINVDCPFSYYKSRVFALLFEEPQENCWLYAGDDTITQENSLLKSRTIHNNGCKGWLTMCSVLEGGN